MLKIIEIFDVEYGNGFSLADLEQSRSGLNFISRTSKNNGVSAKVIIPHDVIAFPPGTITVTLGGSVLEAFLQPKEFVTAYHIFCLKPKMKLTDSQKLYYCACIRSNKFRYNYGRQANKTLGLLEVPSIEELPEWVNNYSKKSIGSKKSINNKVITLDSQKWKNFTYDEIFTITNGYYNKKPPETENGEINFIGASENNNGVTSYHTVGDIARWFKDGSIDPNADFGGKIFEGNCITVANNGNSVASAFFQEKKFTCTHDINVIRLKKHEMNKYIALFLCTLIKKEKYRWSYGRKWRRIRMSYSIMKLPISKNGEPNWVFMEDYIKSLPYSSNL